MACTLTIQTSHYCPHLHTVLHTINHPTSYTITIPPKVWCPKPSSHYVPLDYGHEFDEGLFVSSRFGKTLKCTTMGIDLPPRDDIRIWDPTISLTTSSVSLMTSLLTFARNLCLSSMTTGTVSMQKESGDPSVASSFSSTQGPRNPSPAEHQLRHPRRKDHAGTYQ